MSKFVEESDGFARDENGKIHIRPLKLIGQMTLAASLSGKKTDEKPKRSVIRRNLLPIEPLCFDLSEFEELQHPPKRARIEKPVRKALFKVPQDKQVKRLSSYGNNRRNLSKTSTGGKTNLTSKKLNVPAKKQVACNDGSPLFDVEEAEEFLSEKQSFINPVKTVLFPPLTSIKEESNSSQVTKSKGPLQHETKTFQIPPTKNVTLKSPNVNTPPISPSSLESDLEFIELEKTLASAKKSAKNGVPSPMTSVCSLLAKTNIASPKIAQKLSLSSVLNLVKENKKEIQAMRERLTKQESNLDHIIEYLEQKEKSNKENSNSNNRRSIRIATQSTKPNVVSPAMSKKEDLRKKTLFRNFSRNLSTESPRTKKAVDMYNTMRNDCSVLCTPKLDRSNIDMPQTSVTRSLSRRIQKQCLLLQDTPRPKTS